MRLLDIFRRKHADSEQHGSQALAKVSHLVRAQIVAYGAPTVRKQVIKSIETDCRRVVKKLVRSKGRGMTLNDIMQDRTIQQALDTSEYMEMLRELGLDRMHIEVAARDAMIESLRELRRT